MIRGPADGSNAHRFVRDAFLGAKTDPVSGVGCLVVDIRDELGIVPVVSLDAASRRSIHDTVTAVTTFFALAEAFLTAQRTSRFANMLTTILVPTIPLATSRHIDPSLVGFAFRSLEIGVHCSSSQGRDCALVEDLRQRQRKLVSQPYRCYHDKIVVSALAH